MSQFKNNSEFNLYYTDTDSIFIDRPLPDVLVTEGLGMMKLEYTLKDSIFLAPKLYCGITSEGKKKKFVKLKVSLNQKTLTSQILKTY